MQKQSLSVLGATGSIGTSTLDVVRQHRAYFEIFALTGHRNLELLAKQCLEFSPRLAVVADEINASALRARLPASCPTEVKSGPEALIEAASATEVDTVMAAITGAAGMPSTLAAARCGKRLLLANKEALVVAGELVMPAVRASGSVLLPIDSEHNALFQCLPRGELGPASAGVDQLLLTASGGPFRGFDREQMAAVTPEQALKHPNWSMGAKITIDSASMMNKGLEIIEACWLFDVPESRVDVVVHPESVVHSLVSYVDGSVLAQLGHPDMRTPIAYGLAWPQRIALDMPTLDLAKIARLNFEPPDEVRFPSLGLAREVQRVGGTAGAILNAANEVAVEAFLQRRCQFLQMAELVDWALTHIAPEPVVDIEGLLSADQHTRTQVQSRLASLR